MTSLPNKQIPNFPQTELGIGGLKQGKSVNVRVC